MPPHEAPVTAEILVAVVGTVVGVIGLIVGVVMSRRAERIATNQHQVEAAAFARDWYADLRSWAAEAIDVLSEAIYLSEVQATPPPKVDLLRCRHRLSALIDRGRFFLPNQRTGEYGQDKPPAFRGLRHTGLDPLVAAERVLGGTLGTFPSAAKALVAMKREFVSCIYRILAPEDHNKDIASMIVATHKSREADPTLGGLLPDGGSQPVGAERLLYAPESRRAKHD